MKKNRETMTEKPRYKIIACDLDETLLGSDRKISPENRAAIQKARALGVKFVPATGRGFTSVGGVLEDLGLADAPEEYVLSYNGGAITENRGNRLLHFQGLDFAQADALFRRGLQYDVCIHVYTQETVYVYDLTDNERAYLRGRMAVEPLPAPSIDFLREVPIGKILFNNTDLDYLARIERELSDLTGALTVTYSSARYLEFNPKGVDKGSGLLHLAELLGVDPAETIAIGDNFNDRPMIQAAGLGVGVANAVKDIRPDCDYITQADNDHSAVAEVIRKFVTGDAPWAAPVSPATI